MSARYHLLGCLFLLASAAYGQSCTPNAARQAASKTLTLQHTLSNQAVDDDAWEVPAPLRPVLHNFKQSLIEAVDIALRCDAGNLTSPAQIQAGLTFLFKPTSPNSVGEGYTSGLTFTASAAPPQPGLLAIQIGYTVPCGDDNLLLLYRHAGTAWQRELIWSNPDLNSINDALGDFFSWSVVPSNAGHPYLVAVAYGTPNCTSRFSMFHIDLVAPAGGGKPQTRAAHLDHGYSRFEHIPDIRATSDGFQLRAWDDSLDSDNLSIRPRVYRFRTTGGTLDRTQPIADNARDFIDAWLQLPWAESAQWTANPSPALKATRDRFDSDVTMDTPSIAYGPVRACGQNRFQIELDLTEGAKLDQTSKLFAQVAQGSNAFTVLAFVPQPDPTCTGPDLMKKR